MIITEQKPFEEILEMVKPYKKIAIIGCDTCATLCQTGGEEQVKEMAEKLKDRVVSAFIMETPCDMRTCRRDLRRHREELEEAEAILVMSCGAGVQNIADLSGKVVIPALNTKFLGKTERIGRFYEMCRACGDCILYETGGICPLTRCAKGLLNGPCGGQVDGKCEVGGYERDCAWVLIWKRLKEQGRLDLFKKFRPPRDRSYKAQPQELLFR